MFSDKKIFVGIDIGTSSVKAGFVRETGDCVRQVSVDYPTYHGIDDSALQDPADWWRAASKAVQALAKANPDEAKLVQSISISCQAPSLMGIGKDGLPVGKAMIWMDTRASQIMDLIKEHEEYIRYYSNNRIDPYFMLSKLVWFKEHEPELYERTSCFLQANGYLVYQLTGMCVMDVTNANLTQLMNVYTLNWDTGIFNRLELDQDKFPPIVPCQRIVGKIRPQIASLWGLPQDIVVIAGSVDGSATPYGLRLAKPGNLFEMSGTSSGIGILTDRPLFSKNLVLMKHVEDGLWFVKGSTSSSGGSLQWFKNLVDENRYDYEDYDSLAKQSVAGANGVLFLPYLNGERAPIWENKFRGICLGFSTSTPRCDLIRAVMEGTAYALRSIQEELPKEIDQDDIILGAGGGYRSQIWSQIKADVLGKPIRVYHIDIDAGVLGSAYLAMKGCGVPLSDLADHGQDEKVYVPELAMRDTYEHQYQRFCKAIEAARMLYHM